MSSYASDLDNSDANDLGNSDTNDLVDFDTNNPDHSDISNFDNAVSDSIDDFVSNSEAALPKRSRWLLMSAISCSFSGHIDFHKLPGRKLGIMLYRKGSDILASHHHLLHQERMKRKSLHDNKGLHNMGLTLSMEDLLFEPALIHNNIVIGQAKSAPKPLIDQADISKISLANLISDTDSRKWNFIYLMTMNKTSRNQFEKKCGIDWWSDVCGSKGSGILEERTSKMLMIISLSLFTCNDQVSLLQLMRHQVLVVPQKSIRFSTS